MLLPAVENIDETFNRALSISVYTSHAKLEIGVININVVPKLQSCRTSERKWPLYPAWSFWFYSNQKYFRILRSQHRGNGKRSNRNQWSKYRKAKACINAESQKPSNLWNEIRVGQKHKLNRIDQWYNANMQKQAELIIQHS